MDTGKKSHGCAGYRAEMMLLMLRRRLNEAALTPEERAVLERDIQKLQVQTGIDD